MLQHASFVTTSARGLDRASVPMRLFEKAKRLGIWNPSEIDFTQDAADWQRLDPLEREVLLHLTALFQAGEEAVTNDIVPLLLAVSGEGRVEEELYLTTFLFEEAKHTDFFRRFLDTVAACDDRSQPLPRRELSPADLRSPAPQHAAAAHRSVARCPAARRRHLQHDRRGRTRRNRLSRLSCGAGAQRPPARPVPRHPAGQAGRVTPYRLRHLPRFRACWPLIPSCGKWLRQR